MHDLGDVLLQSSFKDTIVDMEILTLTYPKVIDLFHDLKHIGANTITNTAKEGMTTMRQLKDVISAYQTGFQTQDGHIPASFEVIYGHAFPNQIKKKRIPHRLLYQQAPNLS